VALPGAARVAGAGRDRTKLVDGLARQVAVVEATLADLAPDVPVRGCFCFVPPDGFLTESGLPLLRTLKIRGYPLYHVRRLAKNLNRSGPLSPERAGQVRAALAERLAAA
jgi:hypothetical protein